MTKGYEYNKKWRLANPDKRYAGKKRHDNKTSFAPNYGKEWTSQEEKRVLEHSIPDSQLAAEIGRSVSSIHQKRVRLRKQAP